MIFLAYLCGCLAALANAAASVMQRSASREVSERLEFSFALFRSLLQRPLWLVSIATMLLSFLLQAAGLGLGTLAAVEPLLVLELPLTLIGAWIFLGGRLGRREWAAIVVMTAATSGLIGFLGPTEGKGAGAGWLIWLTATAGTALLVATAYLTGYRARSPGRRAGVLGTGAGLSFGLAAAMTKGMTEQYAAGGLAGVLLTWQFYAAIAAGVLAFWMDQNAVNAGQLAAAQPGITLADPLVSIIWGVAVFGETVRGGGWLAAAALCAAAMAAAVVVLARSPETTGEQAAQEEGAGGGRGPQAGSRHEPERLHKARDSG